MLIHGPRGMPTKGSFEVSISGIDGSGKGTASALAMQRASYDFDRTIVLGRPAFEYRNGEATQIFASVTDRLASFHARAARSRNPALTVAASATEIITQTRYIERTIAKSGNPPDILASNRDPLLDSVVYLGHLGPKSLSKVISAEKQLRTLHSLTGVNRNLMILLKIDPEAAMERIMARNLANGPNSQPDAHENPASLTELSAAFTTAAERVSAYTGTPVIEIDTTWRSETEVADLAYFTIQQTMSGQIPAGQFIHAA